VPLRPNVKEYGRPTVPAGGVPATPTCPATTMVLVVETSGLAPPLPAVTVKV
jgi:hypothetical protein